jgi:hypothetical protein
MAGASSTPIRFTTSIISPWLRAGLEARQLDEAVEHVALRLGDPAERLRVDPQTPSMCLPIANSF